MYVLELFSYNMCCVCCLFKVTLEYLFTSNTNNYFKICIRYKENVSGKSLGYDRSVLSCFLYFYRWLKAMIYQWRDLLISSCVRQERWQQGENVVVREMDANKGEVLSRGRFNIFHTRGILAWQVIFFNQYLLWLVLCK